MIPAKPMTGRRSLGSLTIHIMKPAQTIDRTIGPSVTRFTAAPSGIPAAADPIVSAAIMARNVALSPRPHPCPRRAGCSTSSDLTRVRRCRMTRRSMFRATAIKPHRLKASSAIVEPTRMPNWRDNRINAKMRVSQPAVVCSRPVAQPHRNRATELPAASSPESGA